MVITYPGSLKTYSAGQGLTEEQKKMFEIRDPCRKAYELFLEGRRDANNRKLKISQRYWMELRCSNFFGKLANPDRKKLGYKN